MGEADKQNRGKPTSWRIPVDIRKRVNMQAVIQETDAELLVVKWLKERLDIEESPKKSRK